MHGCKKKWWMFESCLQGLFFLAELYALSFFFFFFCFLRGRLSGFDSRLRVQIFWFLHSCAIVYILWEEKEKRKKQIKKILQFGLPPDELSSQHVFCSEQPNPHHLFPDLRVCLSFVLQAFFFFFLISIYFNFFNKQTSRDLKSQMSAHEHTQRNVDFFQQH